MKALILAAGDGTRLRPISNAIPKHLVPIANKPVIEHIIEHLKSIGVTDIGVVVGTEADSPITQYLGSGDRYGVEFTYIVQEEPKGLAHAVQCGEDFVGSEPVLVYFGDTLISSETIKRLVSDFNAERHSASLGLKEVEEPSRYGIADFDKAGELIGMEEKPNSPPSDLAYIGAVVLSPIAFEKIESQTPSDRGELELTDTIDLVIRSGEPVNWETVDGLWHDVGTPEDVISANRTYLDETISYDRSNGDKRVLIGPESNINEEATIKEPVVIGSNTTIGPGTALGPYVSIGDRCTVSGVHMESSVVMDDVEIIGETHVKRSLIGAKTEIKSNQENASKRFILGSDTTLSL